jgi:hypothetical protein
MRDLDVRLALRRELTKQHLGDERTLIVEEMGIWSGSVRVDVAVVNGELHGFEIKSARDTLARLPAQQELYSQVFDRVTLVVADKHVEKAELVIPRWWATLLASSNGECAVKLREGRPGGVNPQPDVRQIVRLLWREELIAILDRHGCSKGYRSASSDKLGGKLIQVLPFDVLRLEVREALKRRTWSRKAANNKSEVTIGADLDPLSSAPGAGGWSIRNCRDALVAPTPRHATKI